MVTTLADLMGDTSVIEVARKCRVSRQAVYYWLDGSWRPSAANVKRLSVALGVTEADVERALAETRIAAAS
jgi:transcriptional regulator with XRE-family HTH domain